jgi:3-hydroxyacyl-[acyl-carrier-protein] dehydratase
MERPEMAGKVAMILQIPDAQLTQPVEPGDTLRVEAEVLKLGERLGELRGAIYRGGEKVAEGKVRFAIVEEAQLRSQESGVRSQKAE